jgi:hypothetical protein
VAHDALLEAWRVGQGGRDPRRAYVRFVESGLADPPQSPFREVFGGWILGSERFVARLRRLAGRVRSNPAIPEARRLSGLDPERIIAAVAEFYGLEGLWLSRRDNPTLPDRSQARCAAPPHRGVAPATGGVAVGVRNFQCQAQSAFAGRTQSVPQPAAFRSDLTAPLFLLRPNSARRPGFVATPRFLARLSHARPQQMLGVRRGPPVEQPAAAGAGEFALESLVLGSLVLEFLSP